MCQPEGSEEARWKGKEASGIRAAGGAGGENSLRSKSLPATELTVPDERQDCFRGAGASRMLKPGTGTASGLNKSEKTNNLFYLSIYFLAVLGLHCCMQAFSGCGEWKLL